MESIYISRDKLYKFKLGYDFLFYKLDHDWRINNIDKLLISIAEEYIDSLEYAELYKGNLDNWEFI